MPTGIPPQISYILLFSLNPHLHTPLDLGICALRLQPYYYITKRYHELGRASLVDIITEMFLITLNAKQISKPTADKPDPF